MSDENNEVSPVKEEVEKIEKIDEEKKDNEGEEKKENEGEVKKENEGEEKKENEGEVKKENDWNQHVNEEPLEYKVAEPPLLTLDKLSTILLIGVLCLVFQSLIATIGICHSWLLAFTLWIASSIAFVAIFSKKLLPCGKNVLITGCDTGFGHALAIRLEKLGFRVFALCLLDGDGASELRAVESENLRVILGDVTKPEDMKRARKEVEEHLPEGEGLWGVVNNAGIATFGFVEWQTLSTYKRICEVNVFGTINVTQTFLPLVRRAKGRVVNVTSTFGRVGAANFSSYVLSKYAVEGFSDCLRHEMRSWGVNVILIEPGNFLKATKIYSEETVNNDIKQMWDGMSEELRSDYGEEMCKGAVQSMKDLFSVGESDLSTVVDAMVCALTDVYPQARYQPMDLSHKTCMFVATHLPEWLYDRIYEVAPQK